MSPSFSPKPLAARVSGAVASRPFRALLAIFGGYAFSAGFFAFFSIALFAAGVSRAEAMWWGVLTSFLVYTVVILWAAASSKPALTTIIILGASAFMIGVSEPLALQLTAGAS